ncbi:hypothetical protein [Nocardia sp. NPDC050406]|uniref:hypothetical protein n=1 Tax=Nocardia sp. NPDC050406 TaxID=3364318 RepID=UPI0037A59FD1
MLDRPVSDVLSDLGIPQLPQLPQLPALPEITLPSIDPTALIQPVVELLSGFGSGSLGTSGFDPTDLFSLVTKTLTSAADTTTQAVSQVSVGWQSDAARAAMEKSLRVVDDIGAVQAQGLNQKLILLDAERVVAQGYAELSAVIAKFVAEVIAGAPLFITPAGLPALLAMASQVVAEAGVIAAKTRGELSIKTAEIVGAGMKVLVTGAPTAADAAQLANLVAQSVQPLAQPAAALASKVAEKGGEVVSGGAEVVSKISQSLTSDTNNDTKTTDQTNNPNATKITDEKTTDDKTTNGGGGDSPSTLLGGGVPVTTNPTGNTPLTRTPFGENVGGSPSSRGTTTASPVAQTGRATTSPMMSGLGAGNRAGAADEETSNGDRTNLVTAAHGDEVVGTIEGVSIPVVGGVEAIDEPPDKELTL